MLLLHGHTDSRTHRHTDTQTHTLLSAWRLQFNCGELWQRRRRRHRFVPPASHTTLPRPHWYSLTSPSTPSLIPAPLNAAATGSSIVVAGPGRAMPSLLRPSLHILGARIKLQIALKNWWLSGDYHSICTTDLFKIIRYPIVIVWKRTIFTLSNIFFFSSVVIINDQSFSRQAQSQQRLLC